VAYTSHLRMATTCTCAYVQLSHVKHRWPAANTATYQPLKNYISHLTGTRWKAYWRSIVITPWAALQAILALPWVWPSTTVAAVLVRVGRLLPVHAAGPGT